MNEPSPVGASGPVPPPLRFIVGVGASAGGLEAFKELLSSLPADAGLSLILVQHLDPGHQSLLAELLARVTSVPVIEAQDGDRVQPNTVYIIPPGKSLAVRDGCLVLSKPELRRGIRLPVDYLFRSLARAYGNRAVGIVLSGTGSDGTAGLREIKAGNGLAIVQDPATAAQPGMPQSAIDAGVVDLILPIGEMAQALARFQRLGAQPAGSVASKDAVEGAFARMATIVEKGTGLDLGAYKTSTVERRLVRRMTLAGFESLERYLDHLEGSDEEQRRLTQDLLIGVTDFFRDAGAFDELAKSVIQPLVKGAAEGAVLRAWVAGCATGQEAYSIAILFLEAIEASKKRIDLQMFATDADQDAIQAARAGVYPHGALEGVSEARLKRWFTPLSGVGVQVAPKLRDVISFATQDVCQDAPFSGMHLVSCRNLLIYLSRESKDRVLHALHFALRDGGVLFLGPSETASLSPQHLVAVSKKWRLYRKTGDTRLPIPRHHPQRTVVGTNYDSARKSRDADAPEHARASILACRVPPTVVVDREDTLLLSHGDLRPYLRVAPGQPTHQLWPLVEPDIVTRVRATVYRARRTNDTVATEARLPGGAGRVRILASPAPDIEGGVVVTFEPSAAAPVEEAAPEDATRTGLVEDLERELVATREDLRNTVAELESANQELGGANEEARSMNEELQSSNEELEASSEELRSLNEELTTLNGQLREKVDQLEEMHHDVTNFFSSTKIATLFLDDALRVRRFTPAAAELTHLDHADRGRALDATGFGRDPLSSGLQECALEVLSSLETQEHEIPLDNGDWYLRRVLPFRADGRRIEGVVVTFQDITLLKQSAHDLAIRSERQEVIARLAMQALEGDDLPTFLDCVVREVQHALRADYSKILELQPGDERLLLRSGVGWAEGLVGTAWVDAKLQSQAGYTLKSHAPVIVENLRSDRRFSGPQLLTDHGVTSGVSVVIAEGQRPYGVLAVHTRERRVFSAEEVDFVVTVAALITSAVTRNQLRLQLLVENLLSQRLVTAESEDDIAEALLGACAESLGTKLGEFWKLEDGELVCVHHRVEEGIDARLVQPFSDRTFQPGEGLVGRVYDGACAMWFGRLVDAEIFLRGDAAEDLGMTTGLGFPVMVGDEVRGVIAVFGQRPMIVEHPLLRSLESVGRLAGFCLHKLDAEAAFLEQEMRATATLDACPDGVVSIDHQGRIIGFNKAAEEMFGVRRGEVLGADMADRIIPSELLPEHRKGFAEHLRTGDARILGQRMLLRARRSSGAEFSAEVTVTRVEGGAAPTFTGYIRDVEARLATEAALKASEERFREMFEFVGASLWEQDMTGVWRAFDELRASGVEDVPAYCREHPEFAQRCAGLIKVLDVNQESVELFKARTKDDLKRGLATVFTPESYPVFAEELAQFAAGEPLFASELPVRTLTGRGFYVAFSVRVAPRQPDGTVRAMVSVMDVTRRRQAEEQLREASRQKDAFMAMLGHELRNPLAAIRSAAQIVAQSEGDASQHQFAYEIIDRQSRQMRNLVDGLLDMARVASGKIRVVRVPVDLCVVVQNALTDCREAIADSGVRLETHLSKEPLWVEGDEVRLTQVVGNLITNSAKYSDAGDELRVKLWKRGDRAELEVRDTGIGIAASELPFIFDTFRQASDQIARSRGGLGLGLALVKALVELHGGEVVAESCGVGQGSCFTVKLPLASAERRVPVKAAAPTEAKPRRVLVIEDHADAGPALCHLLKGRGHSVELAGDGEVGLEQAKNFRPEVVLCDIGLPGDVDGYAVARSIRGDAELAGTMLVALTGYGRAEDRQRCLDAGFDHHLAKPIDIEALTQLLATRDG